jgi:hypothetical protein
MLALLPPKTGAAVCCLLRWQVAQPACPPVAHCAHRVTLQPCSSHAHARSSQAQTLGRSDCAPRLDQAAAAVCQDIRVCNSEIVASAPAASSWAATSARDDIMHDIIDACAHGAGQRPAVPPPWAQISLTSPLLRCVCLRRGRGHGAQKAASDRVSRQAARTPGPLLYLEPRVMDVHVLAQGLRRACGGAMEWRAMDDATTANWRQAASQPPPLLLRADTRHVAYFALRRLDGWRGLSRVLCGSSAVALPHYTPPSCCPCNASRRECDCVLWLWLEFKRLALRCV